MTEALRVGLDIVRLVQDGRKPGFFRMTSGAEGREVVNEVLVIIPDRPLPVTGMTWQKNPISGVIEFIDITGRQVEAIPATVVSMPSDEGTRIMDKLRELEQKPKLPYIRLD